MTGDRLRLDHPAFAARTAMHPTRIDGTPRLEARRVRRDGRLLILPPEGFGDEWAGGSRRTTPSRG